MKVLLLEDQRAIESTLARRRHRVTVVRVGANRADDVVEPACDGDDEWFVDDGDELWVS